MNSGLGARYSWLGVSFLDPLIGWVVGNYGTIIHTTNGGLSWAKQESGVSFELTLRAVQCVSELEVFAVGESATVVHTADGGVTWRPQEPRTSSMDFNALHFQSAVVGWLVGFQNLDNGLGRILHTSNGELAFTQVVGQKEMRTHQNTKA
eukprot:gene18096-21556_t